MRKKNSPNLSQGIHGANRRNLLLSLEQFAANVIAEQKLQRNNLLTSEINFAKWNTNEALRRRIVATAGAPRRHLFYCKHEIMQEVISHYDE